jgi:hypothetical protein
MISRVFSKDFNKNMEFMCTDWSDYDTNNNSSILDVTIDEEKPARKSKKSKKSDRIELLRSNSQESSLMFGFRELPVDCPPIILAKLNISDSKVPTLSQNSLNNLSDFEINKEILIDRIKSELMFKKNEMVKNLMAANKTNSHYNNYLFSLDNDKAVNNENSSTSNSFNDDFMFMDSNNNQIMSKALSFSSINRKIGSLVRNSSLSTISEEKSLSTLTDLTMTPNSKKQLDLSEASNNWLAMKNVLNDFQNKNILIQEILHVFEPSSKDGNFYRNVPIRISSPFKNHRNDDILSSLNSTSSPNSITTKSSYHKSPVGGLSPLKSPKNSFKLEDKEIVHAAIAEKADTALFVTSDILDKQFNKSVITNFTTTTTTSSNSTYPNNVNRLVAKKIRFVKRLKNRIETKRGRPLFYRDLSETMIMKRRNSLESKTMQQIDNNNNNNPRFVFDGTYRASFNNSFKHKQVINAREYLESSGKTTTSVEKVNRNSNFMNQINLLSESNENELRNHLRYNLNNNLDVSNIVLPKIDIKPVYF